jgi:hypothetical protein
MRINVVFMLLAIYPNVVHAAELSPWFGGDGQEPFQVEVADGPELLTLHTATPQEVSNCLPEGCPDSQIAVKGPEETAKAP